MSFGRALILPFDSDEPTFARGFEAGALWEALRDCDEPVEATVHSSNTEMVLRMGDALGRVVVGQYFDDTWTRVRFDAPSRLS